MNTCKGCGIQFTPKPKTAGLYCSQKCFHAQPKNNLPLSERFWRYVEKTEKCWNWTGSDDGQKGYGRIKHGQRNIGAHRASWLLHHGDIPEGLQVLHACDNPHCVNPSHLFLGTNEDNRADCVSKGRQRGTDKNRGSGHGMSKITEDDARAIRAAYVPKKKGNRQEIAARFGVSVSLVNQIIWNQRWTHA